MNHAEKGGNVFDTRFKFTKLEHSKIAEQTGFDRKTVRKYLPVKNLTITPETSRKKKQAMALSNLYLSEKLNEGPYTAARLYQEIKELGFDGGKTKKNHR